MRQYFNHAVQAELAAHMLNESSPIPAQRDTSGDSQTISCEDRHRSIASFLQFTGSSSLITQLPLRLCVPTCEWLFELPLHIGRVC